MIIEITSAITMSIVAVLGAWKVMKRVTCKLGCFSCMTNTTDTPTEVTELKNK